MEKISDLIKRKSIQILNEKKIRKDFETGRRVHYYVEGDSGEHLVIFDKEKKKWTCDCSYFALRQKNCSHITAAEIKEKGEIS